MKPSQARAERGHERLDGRGERVAGLVGAVDFMHLGDRLAVNGGGLAWIGIQRPHHHAHGLAVPARDVLPAAFKAFQAAARGHAAGLHFAQRRGGGILHVTVGQAHAAAREHGLDVVLGHAHARDQNVQPRLADRRHRHLSLIHI